MKMKKKNKNRWIALIIASVMILNSTATMGAEFVDGIGMKNSEAFQEENTEGVESSDENLLFEDGTETEVFTDENIEVEENNLESTFVSNSSFSGKGMGTKEKPYEITNPKQLNEVRNNLLAHYILKNDIDLTEIDNWKPIGGKDNPFKGSLDGKGHKINNMNIMYKEVGYEDYVGLFGYSENASFQNIICEDIYIMVDKADTDFRPNWGGEVFVGGIVGGTPGEENVTNITNCCVNGAISIINCSDAFVGGIVGLTGINKIINCTNRTNISVISNKDGRYEKDGEIYVGGIVGKASRYGGANIERCYNYGNLVLEGADVYGGGISGEDGHIVKCINKGKIEGKANAPQYVTYGGIGGIVGETSHTVIESVNYGDVYGEWIITNVNGSGPDVGGIAGNSGLYGNGILKQCINVGESIVSNVERIQNGTSKRERGTAFRISDIGWVELVENCYSLDTTLVNGEIPTTNIGHDKENGESLSAAELYERFEIKTDGFIEDKLCIVRLSHKKIEDNLYLLTAELENPNREDIKNVKVGLNLDKHMSLVSGDNVSETFNVIKSGEIDSTNWTVKVDTSDLKEDISIEYSVCVQTEGAKEMLFTDSIFVQKTNNIGNILDFNKDIWDFTNYIEKAPLKLNKTDKQALLNFYRNTNVGKEKLRKDMNEDANGLCFGLSAIIALVKTGRLSMKDISSTDKCIRDIKGVAYGQKEGKYYLMHPDDADINSKILAYQLLYDASMEISFASDNENGATNYETRKNVTLLDQYAKTAEKTKRPFLIDYQSPKKKSAHEVVGYGHEHREGLRAWRINGKTYNDRVLIYDCNAPYYKGGFKGPHSFEGGKWNETAFENYCVYYNLKEGIWTTGIGDSYFSCENAYLNFIVDLDSIPDYKNSIYNSYCAWMSVENSDDIQIKCENDTTYINGLYADSKYKSYYPAEGSGSGDFRILMKNMNSLYEIKNLEGSDLNFDFSYKDYRLSADTKKCNSVQVDPKGNICVNGNGGDFKLQVTHNEKNASMPGRKVEIKGNANGTVKMKNTGKGIVLEGADRVISVTVEEGEKKDSFNQLNAHGDLLITNEEEGILIKEDSNSNGDFDKVIASSDEMNDNKKPVIPKLLKVSPTNNAITFTWNKASGAEGYRVYRKINKGKWKAVRNTTVTSYKDTKVKTGYTYTYTVKSYKKIKGKTVYSGYNKKGLSGKLTTIVTLASVKPASVLLEWKKSIDASGYHIYRSTRLNGSYNKIKTITGNTTLKYTDKKVDTGRKYYYKVIPYRKSGNKNILGSSSKVKSIIVKAHKQKYIFTDLSLGCDWSTAIMEDGSLWGWGGCISDSLAMIEGSSNLPEKMLEEIKAVDIYFYGGALLKKDGTMWCWGENGSGECGTGFSSITVKEPVKIMENVKQIASGSHYRAALKTDGSLWMWGDNSEGQLGNGTYTDVYTPVKIMDDVIDMNVGLDNSCAIKADGSLWIWGDMYENMPKKVMDNVKKAAIGNCHFAVILNDKSLWTWGWHLLGVLGDGKNDESITYTPQKVMENVRDIQLHQNISAAIKEDGSLWMWGDNSEGQLGNGTTEDQYYPTCIMKDVKKIELGFNHSGAIKEDGSLWLWGANHNGCLGDGSYDIKKQLIPLKLVKVYKKE